MNLLAAAATFGVMTALFQWGWGIGAFGLGTPAPVESFLPVFILPILFGLSIDYQAFLVSRMSEEWDAVPASTGPTPTAPSAPGRSARHGSSPPRPRS